MRVLGLFAKWPQPGQVKTRLAAATSAAWAARVTAAFLHDTIDRLFRVDVDRVLVFDPPDAAPLFADLGRDRFTLVPQEPGDLGQRMSGFIDSQFRRGATAVVLAGIDSPTLPVGWVDRAFTELERAQVVLGPATDGGYYLIGCVPPLPPLFEGVRWSTPHVLTDTVARLTTRGQRVAVLPPWYDVDTLDDWRMLQGHLALLRHAGVDPGVPHTEQLAREPLP
jgi:rSAM/selenodomain-associated transferase 1